MLWICVCNSMIEHLPTMDGQRVLWGRVASIHIAAHTFYTIFLSLELPYIYSTEINI